MAILELPFPDSKPLFADIGEGLGNRKQQSFQISSKAHEARKPRKLGAIAYYRQHRQQGG